MTDDELRALADRIDKELVAIRRDQSLTVDEIGAVNWGDVSVHTIERRTDVRTVAGGQAQPPYVAFVIEEADPACNLPAILSLRLELPEDIVIECEW